MRNRRERGHDVTARSQQYNDHEPARSTLHARAQHTNDSLPKEHFLQQASSDLLSTRCDHSATNSTLDQPTKGSTVPTILSNNGNISDGATAALQPTTTCDPHQIFATTNLTATASQDQISQHNKRGVENEVVANTTEDKPDATKLTMPITIHGYLRMQA